VPAKRARGDRLIEEALAALCRALSATGAPFMIVGGIAVIARGVRRLTTDIDAVVRGDAIAVGALLGACARRRIVPRIPDAEAFAVENLVLLLRHEPTGVDLDVSLAWSGFEHEALSTCSEARYGRVLAPMASAESLVVYKAIAARPTDLADIEALLLLHPELDVSRIRKRVRELAELAETPELLEELERALARARPGARRPRPPRRKRSRPPG
jgi:hypothetical protein